jgi:putative transposase
MSKHSTFRVSRRGTEAQELARMEIEGILKLGSLRLLLMALEAEVEYYTGLFRGEVDPETGHRLVVRNGYMPERDILTPMGSMEVRQPRVRDRREGQRFTSVILPPYLRRTPSLDALIPTLYLKGISTNDFPEALAAILGEGAKGLSPGVIVRLKESWQVEYEAWRNRDLSGKRYVYFWADAVYFNVRLSDDRPCALVIVGALEDGTKELVALVDGERESALSWKELLLDLKRRGLEQGPELAVGDGALGFWKALEEVYPTCRRQRCWVHKTANVLDKMPKSLQKPAKSMIHRMYNAPTREEALRVYADFIELYRAKCPRAVECLEKDKEDMFAFYDFPAEHWQHIRSTNVIESTFATVRHRQRQTKGCGSRMATLSMAHQLMMAAQKRWRRLKGYELIAKVITGVKFEDGMEVAA